MLDAFLGLGLMTVLWIAAGWFLAMILACIAVYFLFGR